MLSLNEGILLLSASGVLSVSLEALKPAYLALLNSGLSDPTSFKTLFVLPSNPNGHHTGDA